MILILKIYFKNKIWIETLMNVTTYFSILFVNFEDIMICEEIVVFNWSWLFFHGTFIIIGTLTSFYFKKVFIFFKYRVKFLLSLFVSLIQNRCFINLYFIKVIFIYRNVYFMIILSKIICILNKNFISLLNFCSWTFVLILRISFDFSAHQIIMIFGWVY